MLLIVTPLGSRDRLRIFSITAKASFKECPSCGGDKKATSLPLRVMAMRSPPSARLTISENLRRSFVIVNVIMISEYHLGEYPTQLRAAEFGDHCFAAAEGDGVYAIQAERVEHGGDGG